MAKYLILLLTLFATACVLPTGGEDDMAKRNLENAPVVHGAGIPAVVPVIPSNGMWTGNNQLGQIVDFAPDQNNRQTVLKLDEWGPPEVWTVSLGLEFNAQNWSDSLAARGFEAQAVIEFGVGGSTQKVVVDWQQGTRISLPMNAVNVIAQYEVFTNVPDDLRLSVQLARGSVPSTAFFTTDTIDIANDNILTAEHVEIPEFANGVLVMSHDTTKDIFAAASNMFLLFYGGPASTDVFLGNVALKYYQQGTPIQFPAGARYVALVNLGGGIGNTGATLQFPIGGVF